MADRTLDNALKYAAMGWQIIPLNGKKPRNSGGLTNASKDPKIIKEWWSNFPSANIGIVTGAGSGIVVVDIDNDPVRDGFQALPELIRRCEGMWDEALTSITGRGGRHVYFKHPGVAVPNSVDFMGLKGIDIRGDGGYVVAPPSDHESGNFYLWTNEEALELVPHVLSPLPQYITRAKTRTIKLNGNAIEEAIPDGQRHDVLTAQAGYMRAIGMSTNTIMQVLREINAERCNPPLEDGELAVIADSMAHYPPRPNRSDAGITSNQLDLLQFPRTDAGAAEMLAHAQTGRILYNHNLGCWMLWYKHSWVTDIKNEIIQRMIEVARSLATVASTITNDEEKATLLKYARGLEAQVRLNAAISLCKTLPQVAIINTDLDTQPMLMATASGVIDLTTGDLRQGLPSDRVSHATQVSYQADAPCPRWLKFLAEIFKGDNQVIDFVQRSIGYTLTGLTTEQCLFMLIGNGANGKSVFLDVLHNLLGTYAYSTPFSTFVRSNNNTQQTNDIAALVGRRLVISSETNEGVTLDESRVKSITGSDTITARFLHQEFFEFRPVCKVWVAVNHAPRIKDDSDGFWRRVRRIDFPVQFSADMADKSLSLTLAAEMPGILRWAIEGCLKWQKDGLRPPASIQVATQQYRQDSDPLTDFLDHYWTINKADHNLCVTTENAYKAYTSWARDRELKSHEKMSSEKFHSRFNRDYQRDVVDGRKIYRGISLNAAGMGLLAEVTINFVKS